MGPAPARAAPAVATSPSRRRRLLAGTGRLVRLRLRRDRVLLPAWALGVTGLVAYFVAALELLYETEEDLAGVAQMMEGPLGALMGGPGYGFDAITLPVFFAGTYWLYVMVLVGLMSILVTVRHTRREEVAGRTEPVLAGPVGRLAPLASALVVVVTLNVAVAVLTVAVLLAGDYPAAGSWTVGAGVGALGLVLAAVAALTAQIAATSRAAAGLAGVVLGAAFAVRSLGDLLEAQGSWLSWLSPLAWSQQTRAYVDERWWPLLLSLAAAAVLLALAARLAARRDLGAGALGARPGAPRAPGWLRSPLALAVRLQRGAILGWGAALLVLGGLYGGMAGEFLDAVEQLPDDLVALLGGSAEALEGYLALMGVFDAVVVSAFALLALHALRAEEASGRAEALLATPVSRGRWFGTHLAVTAGAAVALLAVTGVAMGAAAAATTGDGQLLWLGVAAHLAVVPGVLVILGLGALLLGSAPRALLAAWVVLGHSLLTGVFGDLMDLPDWLAGLSPFAHLAAVPQEDLAPAPVVGLIALAVGLAVAGAAALRRRDLRGR